MFLLKKHGGINIRCYGNFKDDRVCDLCKLSQDMEIFPAIRYKMCKEETEKTETASRKLTELRIGIKKNCPYYKETYDTEARIGYFACTLKTDRKPPECTLVLTNGNKCKRITDKELSRED